MNSTREMLEAALALDDEAKRDFEQWQTKREQRHPRSVQQQQQDLVYKTFETPRPQAPQSTTMDATTEKQWNDWFAAGFKNYIEQHEERFSKEQIDLIVEFVGEYTHKHLEKVRKEIVTVANSIIRGEAQGVYLEGNTIGSRAVKVAQQQKPNISLVGEVDRKRNNVA